MGDIPGVIILPDANLPGHDLSPMILNFLGKVAILYGKPLQVQRGTNHSQYSASGLISDHFAGNAADIYTYADVYGYDTPMGDHIAENALVAAGMSRADAVKQSKLGGLWNVYTKDHRIQVIWRTDTGGNHHNHVHIGIRLRKEDEQSSGYQCLP
jgi:hypothetical protein